MSLRIGIIGGAGHIGYVVQGMRALEDARICAVAGGCPEEDSAAVRRRINAGPDVESYDDYRDLLDKEKLDIVGVSPFFHLHAEITCEALRRGIPVFSEKPLALTLESLEEVREAQKTSGAPIGAMLAFRYAPAFHTAHRLVEQGVIGEPTVGYSQKSYKRGKRPDYYKKRETWGGIIPWVGIHAIDWFWWVSGRDYVAVTGRHVKLHCPEYPGMEDAATCLFELDNGGSVVMSFDYLRPAGAETHGDDRLRVMGEKGALEARGQNWLQLITEAGPQDVPLEEPEHELFADFALSVIDPDHPCRITTEDAIRTTEVALKARDAADAGERVVLA